MLNDLAVSNHWPPWW